MRCRFTTLFRRAVLRARNLQIIEFFLPCLPENPAMLSIARKGGMKLFFEENGADA